MGYYILAGEQLIPFYVVACESHLLCFTFLQSATQRLWFGRDVFGRRSLIWHTGDGFSEPFLLTSVASADGTLQGKGGGGRPFWSEVPAVGLFCASVKEMREGKPSLHCFPWTQCGQCLTDGFLACHCMHTL